jgi:SAM-dependent methyltransferase
VRQAVGVVLGYDEVVRGVLPMTSAGPASDAIMETQPTSGSGKLPESNKVRDLLLQVGAVQTGRIEVFSERTRDTPGLKVYRDRVSKVVFIDGHYVGDEEYVSGDYRQADMPLLAVRGRDHEELIDNERRYARYRQFVAGRSIVDFGCGSGSFLRLARSCARSLTGVELERQLAAGLIADGIPCHTDLGDVAGEQDVFFMFHCLEHLPDPMAILQGIRTRLKGKGAGLIVVEVPHARDFLLDRLASVAFRDFTLWSQHLVLHTRESLSLVLEHAGFIDIQIEGVQRYGLANHMHWLSSQRPGGHKQPLSVFETPELTGAYAQALARLDATDTLVAIARTS